MKAMATMPDNAFDLAIVDPPYGISRFGSRIRIKDRIYYKDACERLEKHKQQLTFDLK